MKTATNSSLTFINYQFSTSWFFWFVLAGFLACVGLFASMSYDISPFISNPQDLILEKNTWANNPECWPNANWKKNFFIIDLFFPIVLFLLQLFLLNGIYFSQVKNRIRTISFNLNNFKEINFKEHRVLLILIVIFLLATISDYLENWSIVNDWDNATAVILQNIKMVFYGLSILSIIYFLLKKLLDDFYPAATKTFFTDLIRYFYPSLISLAILMVVFASFDQFDALIIELLERYNFVLLSLFFLISLFAVWFTPYYLRFTDSYYVDNNTITQDASFNSGIKGIMDGFNYYANIFTIRSDYQSKLSIKEGQYDAPYFHPLRKIFALSFILILIYLQARTLLRSSVEPFSPSLIVLGVIGSLSLYYWSYQKALDKEKRTIGVWHAILTICIFLALVATYVPLLAAYDGSDWKNRLTLLIINTVIFVHFFLAFTIYRRISDRATFTSNRFPAFANFLNKKLEGLHLLSTRIIMIVLLIGAPLFLAVLLFFMMKNLNWFEWCNPLNIYLVFINGLIAIIAVLDRFFHLYKLRNDDQNKNRQRTTKIAALVGCFIVLILATKSSENKYHDIDYTTVEGNNYPAELKNLRTFTADFLKRDTNPDAPIFLIAADGGGLRAAYWNLLLMHYLDSANPEFYKHVFMTTGASGGCIGQGIYAYLNGKNKTEEEREIIIDSIGHTNFLSADMVGLFCKTPFTSMLPFLNLQNWEDRMEAMARHYFTICGEDEKSYDAFKNAPYGSLWTEGNNYQKLPIFIVNATRAEDGFRAIAHPLTPTPDSPIGLIDLTRINDDEYISFPNALFLTNRFPLFSPAGRVCGKGHFVDGGYLENSGLSTLSYYLTLMKGYAQSDSIFQEFFKRKIFVLSIRNDRSNYVFDEFKAYRNQTNECKSTGELQAILGAAISGGLAALPKYYDGLFANPAFQALIGDNGFEYITIDLPFRMSVLDVHRAMKGQIPNCDIQSKVKAINDSIENLAPNDLVMPPLGRIMPDPTIRYMKEMLEHQNVKTATNTILRAL
ncbi:MAG: hypothetical protein R2825_27515 [Saprospiraceae bacterium]